MESCNTPNDSQLLQKITVMTAILLIDKAWKAVTPLTILNCFKKSGFLKEDQENLPILMDDEEPAIEPLVHISGVKGVRKLESVNISRREETITSLHIKKYPIKLIKRGTHVILKNYFSLI
ncbi:hypothetical protein QE152_g8945 [Popillia japonica]|uniref:DDE-1 domain-containing protein n=1 Tax=Popillia japonica TaxID=7064 RepID=A0AAW1LW93_POPJA